MTTRTQNIISFLPTALVVAATLLPAGLLGIALHESHRAAGTLYHTAAGLMGLGGSLTVTLLLLRSFLQAQERQRRFQIVLDATPDLVGIADASGRTLYLNAALRRFLGLSPDADVSGFSLTALHDESPDPAPLWRGETVFTGPDGPAPVSLVQLTHRAAGGATQFVSLIARDIRTQKAIAAAQSEIMSEILGASLEPEALLGRIAALVCELTGGTGAAVEMIDGETLVHRAVSGTLTLPAGSRRPMDAISSGLCARTGETLSLADAAHDPRADTALCRQLGIGAILLTPLRQAGVCVGVLRVVAVQAQAFSEQDARPLQMLADFAGLALSRSAELAREQALVFERTEALQKLEESQALFWAALNAMRDGFAVQDRDGTVLMCNDSADRLLHLPPGTFTGSALTSHGWRFCREDGTDFPREQHPTRRALATGKIQPEQVVGLIRANQPVQWLAICAAPLCRPGEDRPYAAVQTFADISARKEAETILQVGQDRLHRLHALSTAPDLPAADKMRALLRLGSDFFGLPFAVLSRTTGERYEVLHALTPDTLNTQIKDGLICRTGEMYCSRVLAARCPLAVEHASASDWRDLPACTEFGMEAYLGAPLWVDGQLYGTLCFGAQTPRTAAFTDADLEILRLMAQWAGGELMREEVRQQIESYSIVLEFQMGELEKANAELEALATLDGLTGIKNRRAFGQRLEEEVARATRYSLPLTLLMLDVDHFKSYNDTFGHPEGDEVLKQVARTLEHCARETDLVARYGGEEFVVLLPQTDAAGALTIAERIRRAILETEWSRRSVTVSVGVAHLLPVVDTGSHLIARADRALYQSKAGGRNRVTISPDADYRLAGSEVRSAAI